VIPDSGRRPAAFDRITEVGADDHRSFSIVAIECTRHVFVEFPPGISQGEMPPLWVIGAQGGAELVNYRVQGNHMIVEPRPNSGWAAILSRRFASSVPTEGRSRERRPA
jgi:type IV secretory pathway VirB9-like protein